VADDFLERRGQVGEVQRGQSRARFRKQRHIHVAVGTKARGKGRAHQTGRDQPLVGSKENRDVADGVLGKWHERVGHYGQSQEILSTGIFSATSVVRISSISPNDITTNLSYGVPATPSGRS
jgi:hypothetical protein